MSLEKEIPMKKKLLVLIPVLLLTACAPVTSSSSASSSSENSSSESSSSQQTLTPEEIIQYALETAQTVSHKVQFVENVYLKYPTDKYQVDLYQQYSFDLGYYYENDEEAYTNATKTVMADLNKGTEDINPYTRREKTTQEQQYFRRSNGKAYIEQHTLENKVEKVAVKVQDFETGNYVDLMFDENFLNPFKNIEIGDLTYNDNGTLSIAKDKCNQLLRGFGAIGLNNVEGITITLDDNYHFASLEVNVPDDVQETYTRKNAFEITYTGFNETTITHLAPYTNNNPALAEALTKYENETNFTYVKDYYEDNVRTDHIEGYYTPELVFFHHGTLTDTTPLKYGSTYDYKCVLNEDGIYDVYDYTFYDEDYYTWNVIYASAELPYTIPTFRDIGPTYFFISPAVFQNIGNNQYKAEAGVVTTIGQYFDYEVWGVDTYLFETNTLDCIIELDEDNCIELVTITTHFESHDIKCEYHYENVGDTFIPHWIDEH